MATTHGPVQAEASEAATQLSQARSWGYQLQNIDLERLGQSACDLLVIDYSADGSGSSAFTAAQIATLKQRSGRGRKVLAYMSIGEAEDYRFYWQASWETAPPAWLKAESASWAGNYPVRFWDHDWQKLLFGDSTAYLDRIIGAGFDGVYLDRVDAFDEPDDTLRRPARMAAMSDLVLALADYARRRNPGFLVVPQNGEEMLGDPAYLSIIDGFAKEDLFYGIAHDETVNGEADIQSSMQFIKRLTTVAKPMFVVEYLSRHDAISSARRKADGIGATLLIASRELDNVPDC